MKEEEEEEEEEEDEEEQKHIAWRRDSELTMKWESQQIKLAS